MDSYVVIADEMNEVVFVKLARKLAQRDKRLMKANVSPQYLLFSATQQQTGCARWQFVLRTADGQCVVRASEEEPDAQGGRLELLAVVRGLEALDQPSQVTLVTPSRYVCRGLRYGLEDWRTNNWQWERFGRQVPIKNQDLWQRIDQALRIHRVRCVAWRPHPPHHAPPRPHMRLSGRRIAVQRPVHAWSRLVQWLCCQPARLRDCLSAVVQRGEPRRATAWSTGGVLAGRPT